MKAIINKPVYRCDSCGKLYSYKASCEKHEEKCLLNDIKNKEWGTTFRIETKRKWIFAQSFTHLMNNNTDFNLYNHKSKLVCIEEGSDYIDLTFKISE